MSVTIFHATNTRDSFFYGHDDIYSKDDVKEAWKNGGYLAIAKLAVNDLDAAYHWSQNIESSWTEGQFVEAIHDPVTFARGGARSLSVGDIVKYEDEYHIVASLGFELITL